MSAAELRAPSLQWLAPLLSTATVESVTLVATPRLSESDYHLVESPMGPTEGQQASEAMEGITVFPWPAPLEWSGLPPGLPPPVTEQKETNKTKCS